MIPDPPIPSGGFEIEAAGNYASGLLPLGDLAIRGSRVKQSYIGKQMRFCLVKLS